MTATRKTRRSPPADVSSSSPRAPVVGAGAAPAAGRPSRRTPTWRHGPVVPARRLALAGRRARPDVRLAPAAERGPQGDRRRPRRPARPSSDTFSATSIGLLANSVIPIRVGTVLAPYALFVLLRRRGAAVPFATTLGMTLTEQLFAIASFVALSLLFVSALSLPGWAVEVLIASAVFAATFLVGGIVLERRRRRLAAADGSRERGAAPGSAAGARPAACGATGPRSSTASASWASRGRLCSSRPSRRSPGWSSSPRPGPPSRRSTWAAPACAAPPWCSCSPTSSAWCRSPPATWARSRRPPLAALAVSGVAAGPAVAYALGLQGMQLVVGDRRRARLAQPAGPDPCRSEGQEPPGRGAALPRRTGDAHARRRARPALRASGGRDPPERLGHATVSITLDTYSHAIPALLEEAAARIAELVFAGSSPR